jgi:chromosome segregation protein
LVTVPEPYKPVLDALFGDTLLVDDLNQAVKTWNGNMRHQCLVTYEGDMIERSGVVTGGQLARASQGFLARKREIKELAKKVSEGQKVVREAQAKLGQILTDLDEGVRSLTTLEEEKELNKEKINDLDKINFRLSHELDQLEKLLARLSEEQERENNEQSKHKEALTRVELELAQCKERREQEEIYLRAKEIELRESEEEFENIRNGLGALKMEQSRSLEQEKGLLRELDRIHDFIHEGNQMLSRLEKEISTAQMRCQECLQREEELREELKSLYDVLEQAQERVHRAEYERQLFQNEIKEEEKKGEALRQKLDDIREKIHRAKMEESEVSFKMNGLLDQVREMFNLDLATVYADHLQEDYSRHELEERLERQKEAKERLGEVNLTAIQEHEALMERHTFITDQRDDLVKSIESLAQAIRKINKTSVEKFMETFVAVDKKLKEVFPILFTGGEAGLKLMDETKPLESGVLVEVRPPGKKLSHMGLLSGGEKALVAMALLFAIYLIKPSPFCLLDEVDAPLDEANVDRFNNLLQEIKKHSQVILVTHNKRSMEIVDRLYGITMEKKGISKIVSVDLQTASMN